MQTRLFAQARSCYLDPFKKYSNSVSMAGIQVKLSNSRSGYT